jgi:beta-galactosidase
MRKSFLLLLFFYSIAALNAADVLYYNHVFAPSDGYVSKFERPLRNEICLNGYWDFQAMALPSGYKQGGGVAPELSKPAAGGWDKVKIKIPSPWNINSFANRNLEGPDHRNFPSYPTEWENVKMAWMKKNVIVPGDWNDKRIIIRFEAVAGNSEVYVNGKKAAENFDLFLPFEADITDYVKPGEQAEILVGVRSQSLFEDNSTKGRRIVPAGSMWGYHVSGIWQDVFLYAVPKVYISNIYVKPSVSKSTLELDVTIENTTGREEKTVLSGNVYEWLNNAGTDIHSAPEPNYDLAKAASLQIAAESLKLQPGTTVKTLSVPVPKDALKYWTPEYPNLYGLLLSLGNAKTVSDIKYERFGWREWTFNGDKQLLNGKVIQLKGDSWHFMGVPQMTRRYAYAWFTALKDANANAVRPHAQIYPRFYLDVADEMGICVLAETANWASDGGPKMDSPLFWENSKNHLKRMVLRDRNHPAVFGWSISNENKPVILNVFNKPEWMTFQKQAWADWRDIVRANDPTRPWISSDGEEDGEGLLPTTVGHYGGDNSLKQWAAIGKPWGVGETSMAYYGTPEQVSVFNGERAYESMLGRMEGLAYECYKLISQQRLSGASYVSVFNIAWYALQPLPLGKKDLKTPPTLDDGIHFGKYVESVPGMQPERMGAYCSTFNPGYDPTLPLYRTWPMFDAIKAANAGDKPAWSIWSVMPVKMPTAKVLPESVYKELFFVGKDESPLKKTFQMHGVTFVPALKKAAESLIIIDGKYTPDSKEIAAIKGFISKGADVWIWSPSPETLDSYRTFLPAAFSLEPRPASSFIPTKTSWLKNTVNSDFYFSEIQNNDASQYGMSGPLVSEGEILLNAGGTNWRRWNKRAEELKTASVLRSENEAHGPGAVFVKYPTKSSVFYISTIDNFTSSEKGFNTLDKILYGAGIPTEGKKLSEALIDGEGYVETANLFGDNRDNRKTYRFWVWSPRPLDNLLIEPDMPKLDLVVSSERADIRLNRARLESLKTIPLKQGWNQIQVSIPGNADLKNIRFVCENNNGFVRQLKTSLQNPDE